jgi:O-antigen/teichoic acid export membrane protein
VHGYGLFTLIVTFVTVLNRLTSFRMNEFVVKYVTDARAAGGNTDAAAAVKFAMIVEAAASLLALLAVVALARPAASIFLHGQGGAHLIVIYGLVVLATLVAESATGVLQVFNQFRLQSTLNVVGSVCLLAAVSVAYLAGSGVTGMLWASVFGNLGLGVPLAVAAVWTANKRLGAGWWRVPLGDLRTRWSGPFRFALSTNASATLSLVTRDADPLWLSLFRSTSEVGYYRLGLAVASYAMLPVSQLGQAFYPEITRKAARGEWTQFQDLLQRGSLIAAAYLVPLVLLLGAAGKWIVGTAYGAEFMPATNVLLILLIGMGFSHLLFWNRPALLALGRADYAFKVNLLLAAVKVVGIFVLIRSHGYIGAAVLLSFLYLVGVSMAVAKVRSIIRRHGSTG